MNNEDRLNELQQNARDAFNQKRFSEAFKLSNELADKDVPLGILQCAYILENGWGTGAKDLDQSFMFFRKLAITCGNEEGYLGCVRVKLAMKDVTFKNTAIDYCNYCAHGDIRRVAYILLGRVYEELCDPPEYKRAKASYLRAVRYGSGWAMRLYARTLGKSGNILGSVVTHIITTVLSPFFLLLGGVDTTRRG